MRTWLEFALRSTPARTGKGEGRPTTTTDALVPPSFGSTLARITLETWLYLICILAPIAAAISSLLSTGPGAREAEWVEYDHADAQPGACAQREPMPDYDDPFLRADHPFWGGKPPAEVMAGEHEWVPPQLRDLPPVTRVARRAHVKAVVVVPGGEDDQELLPVPRRLGGG